MSDSHDHLETLSGIETSPGWRVNSDAILRHDHLETLSGIETDPVCCGHEQDLQVMII